MSRNPDEASDLESNMPQLPPSQGDPAMGEAWRSPTQRRRPRNSTFLLEAATILALLQLSKEAKFASS